MKSRLVHSVLILSLCMNAMVVVGTVVIVEKKGGLLWLTRKFSDVFHPAQAGQERDLYQNTRLSVFEELSVEPEDIIFLGDSTLDFGEWHEFFSDHHVKNRSINGDDTHTILERLDPIVDGSPRHVILLCGANNFQKRIPFSQTTDEYTTIVSSITSRSQTTELWLLPVFPVNIALYKKWIIPEYPGITMPDMSDISKLNAFIENFPGGNRRIHFVDTSALIDQNGELNENFTLDGLHLNGRGLKLLAMRLRETGLFDSRNTVSPESE